MRPLLLVCALLWGSLLPAASQLQHAERLYGQTRYEESLNVLLRLPQKDAPVLHLLGRDYFMLGDYKKSSEFFAKAVAADPQNSEYVHWLGRAYGRRAETSTPFTAPGYANKAREAFEKAVQLDPKNLEAISDLFEFYLQAPGFLGGGFDKASALTARIAELNPVEGHWAQARLAEKRREYSRAEEQLRRAVQLAPRQVGRIIDLAKFLAKQGRVEESDQAFRQAEKEFPNNPKLMFERAATYVETKRNLDTARELLKKYLASDLTPDDPPRSEAEKLLKQASKS